MTPSGLDAAWGEGKSVIHFVWTDNSERGSGFMLERKVSGGQRASVALLYADTTAYSDSTLVHH